MLEAGKEHVSCRTRQRSRRLRKKLRLGEFQEFGFEISFSLKLELDAHQSAIFWDAFILNVIEPHGLAFGGGTSGFVSLRTRGSVTEAHREIVRSWLTSQPEVQVANIGPLVDCWYPTRQS